MNKQANFISDEHEEVFRLGLTELALRKLEHVSFNEAQSMYHVGRLGQDDMDLVCDMFDASPHRFNALKTNRARAIRNLQRRFGIWKPLRKGASNVLCTELALRIADGEFHKISFVFSTANSGYAPLTLSFDDVGIDYVFERTAIMLGTGDEPGRDIKVEHYDGDLYIFVGQHSPELPRRQLYTDQCPNCEIGYMRTDDYVVGQLDGDYTIDLTCNVCMTSVTINVTEYEDTEEYNDEGLH